MFQLSDVYVWEFPVRFTHWINVVCLFVLAFTGYYIGHPYIHHVHPLFYGVVLKEQWVMGWMRLIHFGAAYVFLMMVVLRVYWAFAGNKYARWNAMVPVTKKQWRDVWGGLKFYLLIAPKLPAAVGHSALAGIAYTVLFLGYFVSIVTGFALLAQSHVGFFWKPSGGWMLPIFGAQKIRLVHHLMMWFLIVFPMAHLYIGWLTDLVEENCVMSSIFSGHKTCHEE